MIIKYKAEKLEGWCHYCMRLDGNSQRNAASITQHSMQQESMGQQTIYAHELSQNTSTTKHRSLWQAAPKAGEIRQIVGTSEAGS